MQHFFSALLLLLPVFAFPQPSAPCELSITLFQQLSVTQPEELKPGAVVYISGSYLRSLQTGVYARQSSSMRHYEYLRPGTREELRDGLNEAGCETCVLGPDGNVYRQTPTPPGVHFFKPKSGFHGEYEPQWRDPHLILPTGLDPVDVRNSEGKPFRVLEFQPSFLRIRSLEEEWVFFTGYPDLAEVFETEGVREKLAEKVRQAKTWVGKEVLIERQGSLDFRPGLLAPAQPFAEEIRHLEIQVEEVEVQGGEVLLGFGLPRQYVVIGPQTRATFRELACVKEQFRQFFLAHTDPVLEQQLTDLMLNDVPVATWSRNQELVEALQNRFRLQQDDRLEHSWYEHALLMRPDLYRETYLTAKLRDDGLCFVQSHYSSRQGLFHTRIELMGAARPVTSSRVSTMDPRSRRQKIGDWTLETIDFDFDTDRRLLLALADEPHKPILVRYSAGGSFFQEVTLPASFREIIRDAWLMAQLIEFQSR